MSLSAKAKKILEDKKPYGSQSVPYVPSISYETKPWVPPKWEPARIGAMDYARVASRTPFGK